MHAIFSLLALLPISAHAAPGTIENKTYKIPAPAKKQAPCPRYDLHGAIQTKRVNCLELALSHMDINDRDASGNTPLHNAIYARNMPAIRFLIQRGADIYLRDFPNGYTPRELASHLGYRRLADSFLALERETERLLESIDANDTVAVSNSLRRGASLGARDLRLDTPLHKAVQSGLNDIVKLLLHQGAKLDARNYLGETPLHVAAMRNHRELITTLVQAGANVNALDERRRTPLDYALNQDDPQVIALFQAKKAQNGTAAAVSFDWSESGPPVTDVKY